MPPQHSIPDGRPTALSTGALLSFHSSKQQELLNVIDKLRHLGVGDDISLPQIIVCGDQSSGKSSVLEAISGIPFPRSDTLCTRFVTEVILRQATETSAAVTIDPSQDASETDRERLRAFRVTIRDLRDFPQLITKASSAMGLSTDSRIFSKDILRMEIFGPKQPELTIVDLPGLIHSDSNQGSTDVTLIRDLVESYMKNARSINLAVVSAKNDFSNQVVLNLAREIDPEGQRTVGLITKPDTLPRGSRSEKEFLELADNKKIKFQLGWHIVKNRSYEERDKTIEERDNSEADFFNSELWKGLKPNMLGAMSLRHRLVDILLMQIGKSLPDLKTEIKTSIEECKKKRSKLGAPRETLPEKKQYLERISQEFQVICEHAIEGNYKKSFFINGQNRLRALVHNRQREFANDMRNNGHQRKIVDDHETPDNVVDVAPGRTRPSVINRGQAIDWIKEKLTNARGRELPGSSNPQVIGELFLEQSAKWGFIARQHIQKVLQVCVTFVIEALRAITDEDTAGAIYTHWVNRHMQARSEKAERVLGLILDKLNDPPTTLDPNYIVGVQNRRKQRLTKELQGSIQRFLEALSDPVHVKSISVPDFAQSLADSSETDLDMFECSEILDRMQSYYDVALTRFIEEVAADVIENPLIKDIWSVFSQVDKWVQDTITKIATESTESQELRGQLDRKLKALETGLEACQKYSNPRPLPLQGEGAFRNRRGPP